MLDLTRTYRAAVVRHPLAGRADPSAVLAALARHGAVAMLESSARDDHWGRHTLAACRPLHVVNLHARADSPASPAPVYGLDRPRCLKDALRQLLNCVRAEPDDADGYAPGWIGYLGYELGGCFERLGEPMARDTALPDLHLGFYDAILLCDHRTGNWQLAEVVFDNPPPGAGQARSLLLAAFDQASRQCPPPPATPLTAEQLQRVFDQPALTRDFTPDAYRRAVARCIDYIAAGDIFQVNLSQRFSLATTAAPADIYMRLRQANPSWYGGCIAGPGWAVLSSSPELFLRYRNGHVLTRPIKGTRRRTGNAAADARAGADLLASQKDNAELAMIIDLLRNDLGRVCRYGSVRVTQRRSLETHPTVLHLVGAVEGQLHSRYDVADLIAATFPGGSITGAPKIRAMEIIRQLEPCARGVYTGSLAHFGVDGSAELNIVIRTAVWSPGRVTVHAGGGIVADSTPQGEYVETLDKARAVLAAVAATEVAI